MIHTNQKKPLFFYLILFLGLVFSFQTKEKPLEIQTTLLLNQADSLYNEGAYSTAIDKLLEAESLFEQEKKWIEVVDCFNQIGRMCDDPSLLSKKEGYVDKGLRFAKRYLSENQAEKGIAFQLKSEIYLGKNQSDSAIIFLEKAADIFTNTQSWEEKAWALIILANVYGNKADYKKMRLTLLAAENLATTHKLDTQIFDSVYGALGLCYFYESDYDNAITTTKKALEFIGKSELIYYADSAQMAVLHENIGFYYQSKSDLTRASYHFQQSSVIENQINGDLSNIILNKYKYGYNCYKLQSFDEAITIGYEILEAVSELSEERQTTPAIDLYNLMTQSYIGVANLDSATYFNDKAIALVTDEMPITTWVSTLNGQLAYLKGNHSEAEAILKPIIQQYDEDIENLLSYESYLFACNALGQTYEAQQKYQQSLEYLEKALKINLPNTTNLSSLLTPNQIDKVYRVDYLVQTLQNKALTLKAMNTPEHLITAFETNQIAITWAEKMRQNFAFEEMKVNLNKKTSVLYQTAIEIAYRLYNTTDDKTYLEEAFVIAEKQKGILLLESLIDEKGKQHYGVPKNLLEKEKELKSVIAFHKQQMLDFKGKDAEKYELNENYFNQKNADYANLKDTLKNYYKPYFDLEYQESIATVEKIQDNLLEPSQAFIQYMATDSLFYVFAIEKGNSHFLALPKRKGEMANLEQLQDFLKDTKAVEQDALQTFKDYNTVAYQSYQQTFEPIQQLLSETTDELILVPDDVLNYVPFEVFLKEKATTDEVDFLRLSYLIRDYQFHYGYSGTLLLKNKEQYDAFNGNDEMLAYAPSYEVKEPMILAQRGDSKALRNSAVQLEGTAKEVKKIQAYFPGSYVFDEAATKTNFQQEAKNYGILHLAMHGIPNSEEPDYAHLIFSTTSEDTDTLLHHYEITSLKTNAQLAVLSACETGVGKNLAGEGVMSLGRAFMYAGVPSVVMSLWKMNDRSTSELMPLFYKHLAEGVRKDEALHQAKLEYLDNATSETAYPFYWAGFVSLGDGQPIKEGGFALGNWVWWIGGLLFLMLLIGFIVKKKRD